MELVDLAARSWSHIYARRRGGYSSSYYDDDDYDGSVGIAVAVWVVIVIIGFMCSLFFWATIYYTIQGKKKAMPPRDTEKGSSILDCGTVYKTIDR